VPFSVWMPLFVLLFALTAGAVHIFLRAQTFWRTFKSFVSSLDGSFQELTGALERLATSADSFRAETPRLDARIERLQLWLAGAAVLQAAVQDARDSFGRLTALYPRK
jgi:sigma54-dependent transcription regulator